MHCAKTVLSLITRAEEWWLRFAIFVIVVQMFASLRDQIKFCFLTLINIVTFLQ